MHENWLSGSSSRGWVGEASGKHPAHPEGDQSFTTDSTGPWSRFPRLRGPLSGLLETLNKLQSYDRKRALELDNECQILYIYECWFKTAMPEEGPRSGLEGPLEPATRGEWNK